MPDTPSLKSPNTNPWYVLMTLYGEQEGLNINWDLHESNVAAWNCWTWLHLDGLNRQKLENAGNTGPKIRSWKERREEIEERHQAEWLRRNGQVLNWKNPSQMGSFLEFWGYKFTNRLVCAEMVFPDTLAFYSCKFIRDLDFSRTSFPAYVGFSESHFYGKTEFKNVNFHRIATFRHSHFHHGLYFDDAVFHRPAMFAGTAFKRDVSFEKASFEDSADFSKSEFHEKVGFQDVRFASHVSFCDANFRQGITLRRAIFHGYADFSKTRFGEEKLSSETVFQDCQFLKPTSFRDAKFTRYPDFSGAILHDKTTFTDGETLWTEDEPKDQERAKECKASCAVIRHAVGKQALPEAEHFFFRREMGFAAQIGPWWQRLPYWLFGVFSDYGYEIRRPFLWFLGLWAFGLVAFWGYFLQAGVERAFGTAFALSFTNVLPAFRTSVFFDKAFMEKLPLILQILSGVQNVLALPLLFFVLLGFRTRFRMR